VLSLLRRRGVGAAAACLAIAAAAALVPAAVAAQGTRPVTGDFLLPSVLAGTNVNADPPGANDWNCTPSRQHPRPVVLVHGLLGNKNTNWQTYAPLLKNDGYCVYALTYGNVGNPPGFDQFGGVNRIEDSAVQLQQFVARVLAATGARKVDIVGHSEGTIMLDYYAKFLDGGRYIDRYVSLASLWHGTNPAGLDALAEAGRPYGITPAIFSLMRPYAASNEELLAHSAFFARMQSGGGPAVAGVTYTNIVTQYDELVSPYTSGIQAGMTNEIVQEHCPTDFADHFEIASDPVAAQLVLNALDPKHAQPVSCTAVLPFVGTVK